MKGNKKILVVAALLLLITAAFTTYAIYKSSATGEGSVNAAKWIVNVNNTDIVANETFTLGTINWATPRIGQNETIAPGDHGTVEIVIDADGSEVAVGYDVTIDTTALNNPNFTVVAASGSSLSGTIPYSSTDGAMERTVTLDIIWTGVDSTSANTADIDLQGDALSIPVTVTATQNPNPAN